MMATYETLIGKWLWYSRGPIRLGYVKGIVKISPTNLKVSFGSHEEEEGLIVTISFTQAQIMDLIKGKKITNDNDLKEYQLHDAWRKSVTINKR